MPPDALAFLKLVLPNEGLKCAAIFTGKRVTHRFTDSFEELAQIIESADRSGHTVYHACASYKTSESRKQSNVLGAKAFWLDVDYGVEHHAKPSKYTDAQAAAEAVLRFCIAVGAPNPLFVSSGHGLHSYWPLDEMLEPERWRVLAANIKRLCDRHELEVDGARACDLASILRTPGTHNRKGNPPILVRWGGSVGPYGLEELGELNAPFEVQPLRRVLGFGVRETLPRVRRSLIADALTIYGEQPVYAEPIADRCAQLGALRSSMGRLAEPAWYAALGVLAHCTDGERFAHLWSSGYPGYTHQETADRLARSALYGPTTCEKFTGVNAKGCEGCPVKGTITSPIQLGRHGVSSVPVGSVEREQTNDAGVLGEEISLHTEPLPELPEDFEWRNGALVFVKESNEGEEVCDTISTVPIYLTGVQTGEINSESFSLKFCLKLPNEPLKEFAVPARIFFSSNGMSELHGKGAVIHEPDLFRQYVREAVDMWNTEHRLDKQFEQYGWKDDASFLFGPNLYVRGETQESLGSGEVKIRNQFLGPCKGGEIGKWSRAANALFTKGCEPQSFALLGSFAAPLMRFHSSGEGGSIISLVNDQSGSGKTTALEAVESVWGRKEAIRLTDDDTRVSKSLILGVLANLPVTWDELYNRDPEVIRQFVLMFTNGRDKMRGTQDGALRHNKATWQTILTLASNNSIVDILSTGEGSDAPAFRVLELKTEIPKGVANKGDDLKRVLRENSGHAGHLYMQLLTKPEVLTWVIEALPNFTQQVWARTGLANEHRFWVRTIASVMAASVLVNKLGILEFSTDRIVGWALEQVAGVAIDVPGRRDPPTIMSEFLQQHLLDTLAVATAWKQKTELRPLTKPTRALQIRYERDTCRIYISEAFLRKWLVKNNISIKDFIQKLAFMKIILREGKRITLGAGTDYASGQSVCYEIDGAHPAMQGGVRLVEDTIPGETRKERVEKYEKSLEQ